MKSPTPQPKIRLSRLRDIGWLIWDPNGLLPPGKSWEAEECRPFANEYDGYLMQAAGQLRMGVSRSDVVNYLMKAETEWIGLSERADCRKRAELVVTAILSDKLLWVEQAADD